jgi:hypothetical protein
MRKEWFEKIEQFDEDDDYIPKYCPECGAQMDKEVRYFYL